MCDLHPYNTQRRQLLKGLAGLTTLAIAAQTPLTLAQPVTEVQSHGCALVNNAASQKLIDASRMLGQSGSHGELNSSGDLRFDHLLGIMLVDLSKHFAVRPSFNLFDDGNSPNAFAQQGNNPNDHGIVLLGENMLNHAMRQENDLFIMGICAHEFGHIVQYRSGYYEQLARGNRTKKLTELHADFLSGYYIGIRNSNYSSRELYSLGQTWETLGDSAYTSHEHHGTPDERLAAIEAGFRFAHERPEFNINGANEVGARYLRKNYG